MKYLPGIMAVSRRFLKPSRTRPHLHVGPVRSECLNGISTVRATVDGYEFWFRSAEADLQPNLSAIASLFLLPALRDRRCLVVNGNMDPVLIDGFHSISRIAHHWWSWDFPLQIKSGRPLCRPSTAGQRVGLFFSCGADSFYSLFQRLDDIDDLILVQGFDVGIHENHRFARLEQHGRDVAAALGKGFISVSTNFRAHPLLAFMQWGEEYHGSGFAAVGHLLQNKFEKLLVSASYPWEFPQPWGSTARMDPFWSGSSLRFEHVGDDLWRSDKLASIAKHPVVQQHLVVCWEGKGPTMNCCGCEKCLRTMVTLMAHGALENAHTFKDKARIIERLDALPLLTKETPVYERLLRFPLPDDVAAAVRRLVERSHPANELASEIGWNKKTLKSRISSSHAQTRYAGGSPDDCETAAYAEAIRDLPREAPIVVLGMTPELRRVATSISDRVIVVDHNPHAIALYRDWLTPEERSRETIIQGDWRELASLLPPGMPAPSAALGDGIFGNIPGLSAHRVLLKKIAQCAPHVRLVVRKALAAARGDGFERGMAGLIKDFRAGRIDEAEFGFCARLAGFLDKHYQPSDFRLCNYDIFEECAALHASGRLTDKEYECILRYRFKCDNCLLTREAWESLLCELGWSFTRVDLKGKRWYRIYPLYIAEAGNMSPSNLDDSRSRL